ncbi:zinc ribbon domain-containing protein [uncultured Sphaerochaeta sp.]|uniref:zinc ribbon domain-containing protein n=1 Tax=uncultured Sphaerochaeta sp. TaxID=886478 RepID=UPI002A0A860D|nr:zinc ribbon domain-containing protein [uncultured Sphaerochaeta sp.]
MKTFDVKIQALHFKRLVIGTIVIMFLLGCILSISLWAIYHERFIFAYRYIKVRELIEDGRLDNEQLKQELLMLSAQSSELVDILILGKDNKVLFSAKESEFGRESYFILQSDGKNPQDTHRYLEQVSNPKNSFELVKHENFFFSKNMFAPGMKISEAYQDSNFFENNSMEKRIFLLGYIIEKSSGDKIYFIGTLHPEKYSKLYSTLVEAYLVLAFMLYWVYLALWVYRDSYKGKLDQGLWGIILLCTNIAGLLVYLLYKQGNQTCFHCGAVQNRMNIYCIYCGEQLKSTCPTCGEAIPDRGEFCGTCGSRFVDNEKENNHENQ